MEKNRILELEKTALEVRKDVVRMIGLSKVTSLAPSLSVVDILVSLYFSTMSVRSDEPGWPGRDRSVLGMENCSPALYATLARKGFFDREELWSYQRLGAMLQGTLEPRRTPGIDSPGGIPGLGIGMAAGIAMGCRMKKSGSRVFCVVGETEFARGAAWESVLAAAARKQGNLCVIVGVGGEFPAGQADVGASVETIQTRFSSFGWHVKLADGHDFDSLDRAIPGLGETGPAPVAVLAKTRWGKGVAFHEKAPGASLVLPDREKVEKALLELEKAGETLEEEMHDEP